MNAVRSYNVSLKYQRSTSSGYKDIGITKIEFVTKTQFLSAILQSPFKSNFFILPILLAQSLYFLPFGKYSLKMIKEKQNTFNY